MTQDLSSATRPESATPLMMNRGSIRTIRVRRKSGIESWAGWPENVVEALRRWNKEKRLSFRQINLWHETTIFRCEGCLEWQEPAGNGVAVLDGLAICDPCLIANARLFGAERDSAERTP